MKKIFLSGGSSYVAQEILEKIDGITDTEVGTAAGKSGLAAEGLLVVYNPKIIDIGTILTDFFKIVSPYQKFKDKDSSNEETVRILYTDGEDVPQIEYYVNFLQCRGSEPAASSANLIVNDSVNPEREHGKLRLEYEKIDSYTAADESCQHYLQKNPDDKLHAVFKEIAASFK